MDEEEDEDEEEEDREEMDGEADGAEVGPGERRAAPVPMGMGSGVPMNESRPSRPATAAVRRRLWCPAASESVDKRPTIQPGVACPPVRRCRCGPSQTSSPRISRCFCQAAGETACGKSTEEGYLGPSCPVRRWRGGGGRGAACDAVWGAAVSRERRIWGTAEAGCSESRVRRVLWTANGILVNRFQERTS